MSKRIRAGLIGCGGISRQHIGALMQMDNAEIVAVCDITPARLAAAAAQTGAEPMEDWTKLVARDDIDIVHVLTPHYLHAPMAIAALKAGKHVLTEKPMASPCCSSACGRLRMKNGLWTWPDWPRRLPMDWMPGRRCVAFFWRSRPHQPENWTKS